MEIYENVKEGLWGSFFLRCHQSSPAHLFGLTASHSLSPPSFPRESRVVAAAVVASRPGGHLHSFPHQTIIILISLPPLLLLHFFFGLPSPLSFAFFGVSGGGDRGRPGTFPLISFFLPRLPVNYFASIGPDFGLSLSLPPVAPLSLFTPRPPRGGGLKFVGKLANPRRRVAG